MKWIGAIFLFLFLSLLLACGNERAGGRLPVTGEAPYPKAFFPHDAHVDDYEVGCKECHHETNAAKLVFPHPDYFDDSYIDCRGCHHAMDKPQEAQACSNCHGGVPDQGLRKHFSAKAVIHKVCWRCHEVGVGVEATEACVTCHAQEGDAP